MHGLLSQTCLGGGGGGGGREREREREREEGERREGGSIDKFSSN